EGHAEPQETVVQKCACALTLETRPNEQPGKKEHQLHQVEKLECTEQVEADPAIGVDDRVRRPTIRRAVEWQRGGGLRVQIGDRGLERQHAQDGETPPMIECNDGTGTA